MGSIDFVVPAHNEESTIYPVVLAIQGASACRRVIVVADACTDQTAAHASNAWAEVVQINAGDKGSAMAAGLELVQTIRVGFIDADLTGLTSAHIDRLAAAPAWSMAVGLRDGSTRGVFPLFGIPPIGGERILPTMVARAAGLEGSGYAAEMRLAGTAKQAGIPTIDVSLSGVSHRTRLGPRAAQRWAHVGRGYIGYLQTPEATA